MLTKNTTAPDFTLPSTSGKNFTLSKDGKGKPLIIYFYPKDNTKVCTQEACDFRDNFSLLKELEVDIVGISTDSITKHKSFKEEHNLPFELLSDRKGTVSKLYKAKMPILNMSKRITYLLDKDHKIVAAIEDLFSAKSHINKMLEQLKSAKK